MVGALAPRFFLASLVAVTKPTNRATLGIARSFHDVNLMCETSREDEGFCVQKNSNFFLSYFTYGTTLTWLSLYWVQRWLLEAAFYRFSWIFIVNR